MRPLQLLFDSPSAAQEIAFMMRGEYDGCTLLTLPPLYDSIALRTAIELIGAEFCFVGDFIPILVPEIDPFNPTQSVQATHKQSVGNPLTWTDIPPF